MPIFSAPFSFFNDQRDRKKILYLLPVRQIDSLFDEITPVSSTNESHRRSFARQIMSSSSSFSKRLVCPTIRHLLDDQLTLIVKLRSMPRHEMILLICVMACARRRRIFPAYGKIHIILNNASKSSIPILK